MFKRPFWKLNGEYCQWKQEIPEEIVSRLEDTSGRWWEVPGSGQISKEKPVFSDKFDVK